MIVGITGTLGAGKGTVVDYLKEKGFTHYSVRDFLVEEINRRGMPIVRDSMVVVANDLRATHDPGYIAQELMGRALERGGKAVIESIRSLGEAQYIKNHGGVMWAVDADVHKRYGRITGRQSETDQISFDKFVADEKKEWENPDPTKQNLKAVIAMADVVLTNDGTPEELYQQVEVALTHAGV